MRRRGFSTVSVILITAVMILNSFVLLSIPPNPSDSVLRAKFIEIAKKYNIPSVILMGIAYTESGWKQFDASGAPIIHTNTDGSIDIGIMQINSTGRSDIDRLKQDVFYNIEVGAKILDGKWKITPAIGDSDRNILENWYYAIWAYNGFSYINHPLNPTGRHYQDKVIDNIARLIIGDDGQPLWTPVQITKPNPNLITNPPSYIDTPTPYHFGDLYENPPDNARIVQANTNLIMSKNVTNHLLFLIQNVGVTTWAPTLFSNPYSAKLTLTNGVEKVEVSLPITKKVQPGETYLLDFPVIVNSTGLYTSTLEFFNNNKPFGQKVLSNFDFEDFTVNDLNQKTIDVSNYTISLNYSTNLNTQFIPYLFVVYKDNSNTLSQDLIQGTLQNGNINFTFLPNFKVGKTISLETYLVFSKTSDLTQTFSYFYTQTYTINFLESQGIIIDSYPTASISLDGNQTNLQTRAFLPLTQGDHTITLLNDGYLPYTVNLNYSSFDYVFVSLKQASNLKPQATLTSFDFGSVKENEAKFVNVTISTPEKNTPMFLISNSKAFSFYPASSVGASTITVIFDARFASLGQNSGSISFSYNGVKNSIQLSANVEMVGATLKANPTDFTVRVNDKLTFDVYLSSNVQFKTLNFSIDYPKDYLEFVSYSSKYCTNSNTKFSFDLTNFENGSVLVSFTFKAIKETNSKLLINFVDTSTENNTKVVSSGVSFVILPPFVKPSKVTGITVADYVTKVSLKFNPSTEGSYKIKDYEIYRGKTNDLSQAIYVGSTTTNSFTDSGPFEQGITYYYWIIAVDTQNNSSDPSDPISVRPIVFSNSTVKDLTIELYINSSYIKINGIQMKMDTAPILINGRTFVPIRYIAEPLGAQVIWKEQTKSVILVFKDKVIELFIGNPLASINGESVPIDKDNPQVAPFIKDGRTMLPLRFVLENFGATVSWDSTQKKITITYKGS